MFFRIIILAVVWSVLLTSACSSLQADETSVGDLIGKLKATEESVRVQAIDELGSRGRGSAEAVAPLAELLKDESANVRAHAARALGEIGRPARKAVPDLVALLKNDDEMVRRQAVRAIRRIRPGPMVMVPLMTKLLQDADPGVRLRIMHALAESGQRVVPGLIVALNNDNSAYWACLVLREMGPEGKDAIPALIERLKDPRPEIRREVILALAAMEEAAAPAQEQIAAALSDPETATAATYAIGRLGKASAETEAAMRQNATSDDTMLSITSLWALSRLHPDDKKLRAEAGQSLVAHLKDKDPMVREAAAKGLASLPSAPEIMAPIWEKELADADETAVRYALDALAALGPPAVPRLIDALKYPHIRVHVAYVLGQIGPDAAQAAKALARLLSDKSERVAHEAALALAKIGPGAKEAVPALIEALKHAEDANAHAIVYALGRIGPDAAAAETTLVGLLDSADKHLALASAWALVRIKPGSAEVAAKTLPVLIAGLGSEMPVARAGAAEALGELGPAAKEAIPALEKAAKDDDKHVAAAAKQALKAINR